GFINFLLLVSWLKPSNIKFIYTLTIGLSIHCSISNFCIMRKTSILFMIGFFILVSCKKDSHIISPPPSIDPVPVTEDYFGKEITDEYRNMENMKDSIVINWYKEQAKYAQKYITGISDRKRL